MTDETTDGLFTTALVLCPHCEEQHEIGLVKVDGRIAAVLNPTADEAMGDLLSDFMGDRMRAKLRSAFGA